MLSVDSADELLQPLAENLVVLDAGAGGDRHDDQRDLTLILGPGGEEPVEGLQTLHDAFGVVQPVDRENDLAVSDGAADRLDLRLDFLVRRGGGVFLEVHAQRKRVDFHHAVLHDDFAHRVFQAADAGGAAEEVADVVVGVKADHIGPEQSMEDLFPPGEQAEQLRRRPGDV